MRIAPAQNDAPPVCVNPSAVRILPHARCAIHSRSRCDKARAIAKMRLRRLMSCERKKVEMLFAHLNHY